MKMEKPARQRAYSYYDKQVGWVCGFAGGMNGRECIVRNIHGEIIKSAHRKNSVTICAFNLRLKSHGNNWFFSGFKI